MSSLCIADLHQRINDLEQGFSQVPSFLGVNQNPCMWPLLPPHVEFTS